MALFYRYKTRILLCVYRNCKSAVEMCATFCQGHVHIRDGTESICSHDAFVICCVFGVYPGFVDNVGETTRPMKGPVRDVLVCKPHKPQESRIFS